MKGIAAGVFLYFLFDLINSNDCITQQFVEVGNVWTLSNLSLIAKEESKSADNKVNISIDPNYVTGMSDGEGNFYISIYADRRRNGQKQIRFYYKVSQRDHSVSMLNNLAQFFNCGTVSIENRASRSMRFVVNNKNDIETKIIPHFTKYPLVTSKKFNFDSFKKAFDIFNNGGHLTPEGVSQIIALQEGMNRGRSFDDKFNSFKNAEKLTIHPSWLQGFCDAEGSFGVYLSAKQGTEGEIEVSIKTDFNISQNIHDISVLDAIKNFFNEGFIKPKVLNISDLEEVKSTGKNAASYINNHPSSFTPFFDRYPLLTQKQLDFLDFKKILALKESRTHLTKDGFKEMWEIASHMNSGRFGQTRRNELVLPEWNKNTRVIIR